MILYLCGQKNCGKSHFGRLVSEKMSIPWYDLDSLVIKANPSYQTCRDLFRAKGEAYYRHQEMLVLENFLTQNRDSNCVISLGGGSFEAPGLAAKANETGITVYMNEDKEILFERIMKNGAPPYMEKNPKEQFDGVFDRRHAAYSSLCKLVIDLDKYTTEQICQTLSELFLN